jgi:hypothetical protein
MAHVLASVRHVRRSLDIYWPAAAIGLGVAASLAWTTFLGYVALGLVENLAVRLGANLTQ